MCRSQWRVIAVLGAATMVMLGCLGSCLARHLLPGPGSTAQSGPPTAVIKIATPRPPTPAPTPLGTEARVVNVIDGDTVEVEMEGRVYSVRYIGIDCPEWGEGGYEQATQANRQLVEGKSVRLVKDISDTDQYGRLLRYVYVGDTFVNAELVRSGFAAAFTYPPDVKYSTLLVQLEREAREAGRGLWVAPTSASGTG
jgi:endonuclease YncB( thermonuclease family)